MRNRQEQELKTKAGIYLRLSRDEDVGRESSSITNQRNILRDYAERNGFTVVEEYADDGYSGLMYDRPAFQRMLKDIGQGRIDAVIVKDLSRLGRDYITNGNYIENIFPRMGVRFICVNESYNEPLVGYEFVRDCAQAVRARGMLNVLVSNGTIEEQPWQELLPLIDAANIDLKGFTTDWYRRLGGDLETVKRSIAIAAGRCHLEVTTLLIPGENDSVEEIRDMCRWLSSVSPDISLHLSRFFPRYKVTDKPPTPAETVYALADEAREFLKFVYTGNL